MIQRIFAIVLACLALSAGALAQDKLGVIVLHGKQGRPGQNQGLSMIASNLQGAGAKVVEPATPWDRGAWETINLTVDQVLAQLDGYAGQLRAQGANRIVVIGHSLGACVVMLAPGHAVGGGGGRRRGGADLSSDDDRARALIDQGTGNETMNGSD